MRTAFDRVDRSKPYDFQGRVVQLPAIVVAHTRIVPEMQDQVSLLTIVLVTGIILIRLTPLGACDLVPCR
jgi:hypothetical protein